MLRAVDDYPFHQTPEPFDVPYVDDPRWCDRYWFMTGSLDERVVVITGIGTYPNTRRIDAYAMVSDGTSQWNLRSGRERDDDLLRLNAHGLSFRLVEPMTRWELACEGSEDFSFQLTYEQTHPPNHLPQFRVERQGEVLIEMGHFQQSGTMTGTFRQSERSFNVAAWPSERDHSWGRRTPSGMARTGLHVWMPAQVGDRSYWLWLRENAEGRRLALTGFVRSRDGREWSVEDARHEIEIAEAFGHRQLVHARLTLMLEGGESIDMEIEPVCPVFIVGGGYVDGQDAQGTFDGQARTRFSIADNGLQNIPLGIIDHFSRVTVDGDVGQGVFELSVGRYEPLALDAPAPVHASLPDLRTAN